MTQQLLDNENFENLFRSHFHDLLGFANSFVRDEEVAKDIVHDSFLSLWKNRHRLDASQPVRPFLFTLVQNYALNYLKHQQVVTLNQPDIIHAFRQASTEIEEHDQRLSRIKTKMAELPSKQQEVVQKCIVEGQKYKEVAEELGISVNTIKTHITRALRFLREELQQDIVLLFILNRQENPLHITLRG